MHPAGLLVAYLRSMEDILCNNIIVRRFVNTPVPSNTFLLVDDGHCLVIDPGSKEQKDVLDYIQEHGLILDYIILTHEHFDHCWGVNYLIESFPDAKTIATRKCAEWVQTPFNYFNQMYYNSDEMYQIEHVDILVEDIGFRMKWNETPIVFVMTPGHTDKGMCVEIGGSLFTGDTVLYKTKPFLKKRYGASKEELKASIEYLYKTYPGETMVYPGHGEVFEIRETEDFYKQYFNEK